MLFFLNVLDLDDGSNGYTKVCSKNMDLLIKKNAFQTGEDNHVDQKTSQNSLSQRLESEVNTNLDAFCDYSRK